MHQGEEPSRAGATVSENMLCCTGAILHVQGVVSMAMVIDMLTMHDQVLPLPSLLRY